MWVSGNSPVRAGKGVKFEGNIFCGRLDREEGNKGRKVK
jgi:hypothetical protein